MGHPWDSTTLTSRRRKKQTTIIYLKKTPIYERHIEPRVLSAPNFVKTEESVGDDVAGADCEAP